MQQPPNKGAHSDFFPQKLTFPKILKEEDFGLEEGREEEEEESKNDMIKKKKEERESNCCELIFLGFCVFNKFIHELHPEY